jgi:hypothetical protein
MSKVRNAFGEQMHQAAKAIVDQKIQARAAKIAASGVDEQTAADQKMMMGPVRRSINLICALAFLGGSACALVYILFYAKGFYYWMLVSSVLGVFVGLYWLWADFINADPRSEK